jgi:hypothetical protein
VKIISIGDTHGRQYWKEIDPEKYDRIIFVGDYVDQYPPMTDGEILNNLLEIIELKKKYPEKVILLIGNHDSYYMFLNEGFAGSGFRPSMAISLKQVFTHNKRLFQIAYQIDDYIWTHAGISQGWYDYNKDVIEKTKEKFECVNLADTLNKMMYTNDFRDLFQCGSARGGRYPYGGIVWADRSETMNRYLTGYHQIVGHTPIKEITKFGFSEGSIRYIDVLNEAYFIDEDRKAAEKKWGVDPNYVAPPLTKFYEFENEHWV